MATQLCVTPGKLILHELSRRTEVSSHPRLCGSKVFNGTNPQAQFSRAWVKQFCIVMKFDGFDLEKDYIKNS